MASKYERARMAKGRAKAKARQKKRSESRKKQREEAEKFGYHRMEGKSFGGRWRGFNAQVGEAASEVRQVELTDELRKQYED